MFSPTQRPSFETDGAAWPNRSQSVFVRAAGLRWHLQRWDGPSADAPLILLLHGAGAATHSWGGLAPRLAERARILAVDLPGHGFTESPNWPSRLSLPGMSAAIADLLATLHAAPDLVVGHSAGAAIAIRMTLDDRLSARRLIALNGALKPFQGLAGAVFPQLARLLFVNPLTPRLFAGVALDRRRVERLLAATGSTSPPEIVDAYALLFSNPAHVSGALGMMAHWDLAALTLEAPRLNTPITLVAAENDGAIPADDAREHAERLPHADLVLLPRLGHLAHEEDPRQIAELVLDRL